MSYPLLTTPGTDAETGVPNPSKYRFYYVDQRQSDGGITYPTGAEAHANTFLDLAQDEKQRTWHYTFVEGKGYVDFQER